MSATDSFANSTGTITLITKEDEKVTVGIKAISMSKVVHDMLENCSADSDEAIPLNIISTEVLAKIIKWCEKYQDDKTVRKACLERKDDDFMSYKSKEIPEFDANLIGNEHEEIFNLLLAANFLDIQPLLDLGCKTVANMMKGKTPEEIREKFNIENDFTKEEEERTKKEFAWLQET